MEWRKSKLDAWGVVRGWGTILAGRAPFLSLEITRECPLSCPGCYAYGSDHLGGTVTLRELRDAKGSELVEGVLRLIRMHKPVHVSLVGGEPLVRYRELNELLPKMAALGVVTQLVTSAVRPIPLEWAAIPRLLLVVSIDGLQPEHDERRKPATYDRILKHIAGHRVTVHCTVTRQQVNRDGYLEEFVRFWSAQPTTKEIWMSLYTPQVGEVSAERLTAEDRRQVVQELTRLRAQYPKLAVRKGMIEFYANPPQSPDECIFAKTTHSLSADFETRITPCQFGGNPDCANCGCIASAGLAALAQHRLPGGLRLRTIFDASFQVGSTVRKIREVIAPPQSSAGNLVAPPSAAHRP
ncbi:MAG: radical SAM protein [Terriglobia bacterium]